MPEPERKVLDPSKMAAEAKKLIDILYSGFCTLSDTAHAQQLEIDKLRAKNEKLINKLLGDDDEESEVSD